MNASHKLQPVRGTHDSLPAESSKRRLIEQRLAQVALAYGFGEIMTPVFEFSEVFHRTLGESSDVVSKETYTFEDRGGESLTLRPEFTASVVRAFISNGLQEALPFKAYYQGPAFRYERPQKGRLRQFHQFGAEWLGDNDPLADAQMIAMAAQCLKILGLGNATSLELNSLGDTQSRAAYREALVAYFSDHRAHLSEDSQKRLQKNPLRILDSKDEGDRKIIAGAPNLREHFNGASSDFIAAVEASLSALGISYTINPRLVRGLDYYSHTVFEFTTSQLGAQGTVLAGGRYDGLVKLMGGPDVPGVGFAAGIERLLALMETAGNVQFPEPARTVAVIPVDEAQERDALLLTASLRSAGIVCELMIRGNMGKKMKRAEKMRARAAVIMGETEVATGEYVVKHMDSGAQQTVSFAKIVEFLRDKA